MPASYGPGNLVRYEQLSNPCEVNETSVYFPRDAVSPIIQAILSHDRICRGLEGAMGLPLSVKFRDGLAQARCNYYYQVARHLLQGAPYDSSTGLYTASPVCIQFELVQGRRSRRIRVEP